MTLPSYVEMDSDVHWSEDDHVSKVEETLRNAGGVSHIREHVMNRRMWEMTIPLLYALLPPAPTDGTADPFAGPRFFLGAAQAHCRPVSSAGAAEVLSAAGKFADIDDLAVQVRQQSALLDARMAYDATRRDLAALPPAAPTDGTPDQLDADTRATVEAQRTALQATLDAATPEVLAEVARHDAWLAAQNPAPADPGAPA